MTYNEQMAIHIASKFYDVEFEEIRNNQGDNLERNFDSTAIEFKEYADILLKKFNDMDAKNKQKKIDTSVTSIIR